VTLFPNPFRWSQRAAAHSLASVRVPGRVVKETPRQAGRSALPIAQIRTNFTATLRLDALQGRGHLLTPQLCPYGVFAPWTALAAEGCSNEQERLRAIEEQASMWCDGCLGCVDVLGEDVVQIREETSRRTMIVYTDETLEDGGAKNEGRGLPSEPEVAVLRAAARALCQELSRVQDAA
jgi:hypothetical protein